MLIPEIRLAVSEASAPSELDVLLAAVGYERRSSFIPLQWAKRSQVRIASAFDSLKVLSYERNCIDLQQAGFHVEEHGESDIRPWLHRQLLEASVNDGPAIRLGVDVSSFSRSRIAQIMLAIIDCASDRDVIADFAYAPAEYRRYQHADAEIRVFGPVAPEFAGWSREPSAPVSCLIGLGYEADRAAGALEFLEPQCVWAFEPSGVDARYDAAVEGANKDVWESTPPPSQVVYSVNEPMWTFIQLESLAFGLKSSTRPILIPFGPKLFTVLSLLVGILHTGDVAVWRVSGAQSELPVDRKAGGSICSIRASFAASSPK